MNLSTVLVTGGAGFIGSHLIERLLADGAGHVICLDNFDLYYNAEQKRANLALLAREPRFSLVEADVCDATAVGPLFRDRHISHVVHLAAKVGVRASVTQPLEYERTNVQGTLVLLEAAQRHPVERFLLVSSSTVYGRHEELTARESRPTSAALVEDAELGTPLSPYGTTKQKAEALARTYYKKHQVPIVCLRPFSVYGPRMRPDLALAVFAAAIENGTPLPVFGDGTQRRDFTHVSDVCRGLLAALTAEHVVGEAINLGHASPVPLLEAIRALEAAIGKRAILDYQPPQAGDAPVTFADLSKARRLLGYEPQIAFADGVRDYVAWRRSSI